MPEQDYPDITLDPEVKKSIAEYLYNEVTDAKRARADVEKVWQDIIALYEKLDIPEKKDYPFPGAANVMIPVIATYVEQYHARLHDTIHVPQDPYTAMPMREDLYRYAKALRKFMTWASEHELNDEAVDSSSFMELLKLGIHAQKVVYLREDETRYVYDETVRRYTPIIERKTDYPRFVHISIFDLLWQPHARTFDESEWKAHRFELSWNDVKRRVDDGRFSKQAAQELRGWALTGPSNEGKEVVSDVTGQELSNMRTFKFWEVWFSYPVRIDPALAPTDEDMNIETPLADLPVALQAVFHEESKELMSLKYNTFPLGLDPFEVSQMVIRENDVTGIGIGHMALPFQIEISTMHNQRLDNATVVNAAAYKYKADSRIPSQLALRPGGGVPVDEMEDIDVLQLGQKGDSTIEAEVKSTELLEQRLGAREMAMDDMRMSQAPATTTLALLQERGRRTDNTLRRVRKMKSRLMRKALLLYREYYPKEKLIEIFGPIDGVLLQQFFELPAKAIWESAGISVTATTSANSRELERVSKLEMFNVLIGYYDKYASYITAALNPQTPPILRQILARMGEGLSGFVEELMESRDFRNLSDYIVRLEEAAREAEAQIQAAQQPAEPGAVADPAAAVPDSGVPPAQGFPNFAGNPQMA